MCLLWSIVNPVHEERLGELLAERLPGVPFTLSHRLNPIIREYRRASSTAIDASLKPLMQGHLDEMADDLRHAGFAGELLVGTSFGGVLSVEDVAAPPDLLGQLGARDGAGGGRACTRLRSRNVIVCDMGGTSFDVSLVRDGYIKFTRETWLGRAVHRAHDRAVGGRHQEHRRRRRQHRLDRSGRAAARRAAERRGPARARLLRRRRHRADRDRRCAGARVHRPRLLPRRAHAPVRRRRARGDRARDRAAARDGRRDSRARRADDRQRAHGRCDPRHHDQRGLRPARARWWWPAAAPAG